MPDADPSEIYCPNCRSYVVPLKAAVSWYCPRCAWQFSDEEIQRRRRPESSHSVTGSGAQLSQVQAK